MAAPACCRASTTSRPSIAASAPCSPTPCRWMPIAAPAALKRPTSSSVWSMRRARKLGMTPDAIRRKNFIPPKAMPYKTATGKIYDSGDFTAHMKRAMEVADWKEFPKRAKAAKKEGLRARHRPRHLCRGLRHHGRRRPPMLRLDPNGDITILIGTQSSGQGHADGLRAARRRTVRCPAGARPHPSGRHRQDRDRSRHRRLGVDPDRRRQRAARHPHARHQPEGDRGRGAGNQRRRPRDHQRPDAHRRHRPLDHLRRSRQAAPAPIPPSSNAQ